MRLPQEENQGGRRFLALAPEVAATVLRTIEAGWARALVLPDVTRDRWEVDLTERLRDSMRLALRELPWGGTMVVLSGTQTRSRPEVLRPDGLTDIPLLWIDLFRTFDEHSPHAIVECKRIAHSDRHLCSDYISEGIDRFRTGKYSRSHEVAFMVGYVIDGTEETAVVAINERLGRAQRLDELLDSSTLVRARWVYASSHPREGVGRIALHHAFLTFGPQN